MKRMSIVLFVLLSAFAASADWKVTLASDATNCILELQERNTKTGKWVTTLHVVPGQSRVFKVSDVKGQIRFNVKNKKTGASVKQKPNWAVIIANNHYILDKNGNMRVDYFKN